MQTPLQVNFRGLDRSEAVEERIQEKIAKLEQINDRIIGCRVVIGVQHKSSGNAQRVDEPFDVSIEMTLPGATIVANRPPSAAKKGEDIYAALKDAFANIERQMLSAASKQREARLS